MFFVWRHTRTESTVHHRSNIAWLVNHVRISDRTVVENAQLYIAKKPFVVYGVLFKSSLFADLILSHFCLMINLDEKAIE